MQMDGKWTAEEQREHRKLWVEALRSGKYQQARAQLHDDDGAMCCLGVACDVSGLDEWQGRYGGLYYGGKYAVLPAPVKHWLGLRDNTGEFGPNLNDYSLANRNDKGATFAELADLIEAEPEGLIEAVSS
jgi:hypothetical protein